MCRYALPDWRSSSIGQGSIRWVSHSSAVKPRVTPAFAEAIRSSVSSDTVAQTPVCVPTNTRSLLIQWMSDTPGTGIETNSSPVSKLYM